MKTLFLLCGLPFSGKSTAGQSLSRDCDAVVISLDEINSLRGLTQAGMGGITPEQWHITHQVAIARMMEQTQSGKNIVIDDTNCFRFLRDNYRRMADAAGYESQVVVMDTSVDVIRQRIASNRIAQLRHDVADEVLDRLIDVFEWPGPDEHSVPWSILCTKRRLVDRNFIP